MYKWELAPIRKSPSAFIDPQHQIPLGTVKRVLQKQKFQDLVLDKWRALQHKILSKVLPTKTRPTLPRQLLTKAVFSKLPSRGSFTFV